MNIKLLIFYVAYFVCTINSAEASEAHLSDINYLNRPGSISIGYAGLTARSKIGIYTTNLLIPLPTNTIEETSILNIPEIGIGVFDNLSIFASGGEGTSKTNIIINNVPAVLSSKGSLDPWFGFAWRVFGVGGDDSFGAVLKMSYSPDTSNKNAIAGSTSASGNLKRGGNSSVAALALYRKFDNYEISLNGDVSSTAERSTKDSGTLDLGRYSPSTDSNLSLNQRWNIGEVLYLNLGFKYKEYGKSIFDNLTAGVKTEISGYNERGTNFEAGLCLFETVHIYVGTTVYNNTYKISFKTNGVSSEWKSSAGEYKYGGATIHF